MSTLESMTLTQHEGWAHVELALPERRNALGWSFAYDVAAIAEELHETKPRVVLLTGQGPAFTVGGDLHFFAELDDQELPQKMDAMVSTFHKALVRWAELPMPVVTAVQGAVAGGGLGLLGVSDTVLAAEGTVFASGFSALGLSGDGLWSWFMPRMLGHRRAVEFVLERKNYTAEQAAEYGLATRVVPADQLRAAADAVVASYLAGPPISLSRMKRLLMDPILADLRQQAELETQAMEETVRTQDALQGIRAFAAKQQPQFSGN